MLRIPVHKLGRWVHPKFGAIEGTQSRFDEMIRNFKANVLGREPYAEFGHSEKPSQAIAQAWVKGLVQEGDTLYALAESTDPAVEDLIRKKQIRYSSPEYDPDFRDKESGKKLGWVLKAVGLVNNPFIPRMGEVVALSEGDEITFFLDEGKEEPKRMDPKDLAAGIVTGLKDGFTAMFQKQTEDLRGIIQPAGSVKLSEEDQKLLNDAKEIKAREVKLAEDEAKVAARDRKLKVDELLDKHAKVGIPKAVLDAAEPILLSDQKGEQSIQLSDDKGNATQKVALSDAVEKLLESFPKAARVDFKTHGQHKDPTKVEDGVQLSDDDAKSIVDRLTKKEGK